MDHLAETKKITTKWKKCQEELNFPDVLKKKVF